MDLFKLFYNHDLRLDKLAGRNTDKTGEEMATSLEDFMKPTPTYSKFYLTGTVLEKEQFGLNKLDKYDILTDRLEQVFGNSSHFFYNNQSLSLQTILEQADIGEALLISKSSSVPDIDLTELEVDNESNVGHFKEELNTTLQKGFVVVYKELAHHGFDLHIFSKENIYKSLFHAFKPLVSEQFRFFSINSKRMRSERHFYFETWTLEKPPHGAEEVFKETVL